MDRNELITKTKVGSLIAIANYKTFNFRKAIFLILKDEQLTNEVCQLFKWEAEDLEMMMLATYSSKNEEISKCIGDRLAATMAVEAMW